MNGYFGIIKFCLDVFFICPTTDKLIHLRSEFVRIPADARPEVLGTGRALEEMKKQNEETATASAKAAAASMGFTGEFASTGAGSSA